ncbi:MAG: phosphoribosylanthranilate isomerase [Candidatus Rokubacteria bacterium]|nr:phosphoribosylanthranilate isomerase [Candidatus Rokubacteria bacterium]
MTRVKICGITTLEDAMIAVDAGADALGFIFVEGTPRFVTPEIVAPIVRRLPPFVTPVGVFWDHPGGHVKAVAEACALRALQFHGDESPEDLAGYALPVIKTVKIGPRPPDIEGLPAYQFEPHARVLRYVKHAGAILLDSAAKWSEGETRPPIEWEVAARYAERSPRGARGPGGRVVPIILSAGLTADNVARAIATARPYAVDVNSGVEARPGRKDPDKVWRFVAEVRKAA